MYWNSPVSFGVYVNNDFGGDGTGDTIKRTDTPLHPAGSGSGSGGNYFADSAKRDSVPTPKKVEMEKKSELTAQAAKVEVQGEDDETKVRETFVSVFCRCILTERCHVRDYLHCTSDINVINNSRHIGRIAIYTVQVTTQCRIVINIALMTILCRRIIRNCLFCISVNGSCLIFRF